MASTTRLSHVEGLKELEQALLELPKATARSVVRRALIKAAGPIHAYADRVVPVRVKGRNAGRLKRSLAISDKLTGKQKVVHRKWVASLPIEKAGDGGWRSNPGKAVFVFVGAGAVREAVPMEFGTFKDAPTSYMRRAWDAAQDGALRILVDAISAEIAAAVQRIARKAAR